VRSASEREATAAKYSGSCSVGCQWVLKRMGRGQEGRGKHTVVIAAELDEIMLQCGENRVEGVEGGLLRCVSLVELDGFLGRHLVGVSVDV